MSAERVFAGRKQSLHPVRVVTATPQIPVLQSWRMNNQDYIDMCDQTLDRLRKVVVGTRGPERKAILKNRLLVLHLRSFFIRKEKFDARKKSSTKAVPQLEIRPPLGKETSLRQQGKIAKAKAAEEEEVK